MMPPRVRGGGGILDVLGSDYSQVDPADIEFKLSSNPKGNVLVDGEKVEMAFNCGRDSFVLTTLRMIKVNVQGMTGSKVEYLTILWPAIKGYSIETAGGFLDRDAELKLFFDIPDVENDAEGHPRNKLTRMKIDFHKSTVDLFAVQRYVSDKLLGPDAVPPSKHATGGSGMGPDEGSGSLRAWLGDDNRIVDAAEADDRFHSDVPILQRCEHVELAFKGRRDMLLFTTKRAIFVDVQGFMGMGKKVEYMSLPYTSITAFSVRTAGNRFDNDSELRLWLDFDDVFNPVRSGENEPPPPTHSEEQLRRDRLPEGQGRRLHAASVLLGAYDASRRARDEAVHHPGIAGAVIVARGRTEARRLDRQQCPCD